MNFSIRKYITKCLFLQSREISVSGPLSGIWTPTLEDPMAWTEATRAQHGRAHDDRQDDLRDAAEAPLIPAQGRLGRPRATDPRCDPVPAVVGLPVAAHSALSSAVRNHFCAWRNTGVLERMLDALRDLARVQAGIIDSQSVKTTESGGPSGSDAGKQIRGRKRHIAADVEGSPIVVHVHPADVQGAPDLMVDLLRKARGVSKVFADGGTRGSTRRDRLKELTLPDLLEIVGKPEGCGADLRPEGAMSPVGRGLRAEPGELPGPGTARRLPLPDAQVRARTMGLIHENMQNCINTNTGRRRRLPK